MDRRGAACQKRYKGIFYFDPADRIYKDHFPGSPVVPGSLIVQAFFLAAKKTGLVADRFTIEKFRFRRFVPPGEYSYTFELLSNLLKCRLYKGNKTLVTGVFKR